MSQLGTVLLSLFLISCSHVEKKGVQEEVKNKEFEEMVKIEPVTVIKEVSNLNSKTQEVKVAHKKKDIEKKVGKPIIKTSKKTKTATLSSKNQIIKTVNTKDLRAEKEQEMKTSEQEKKTQKKSNNITEKELKKLPFRVGEKTTIEVSYLNMTAGHLILETKGIVKVNGQLSYHFRGSIKSRKLFSFVYSVDDVADTYVDMKSLRPYSLTFKVVETKKTKDSKTYFNWETKKATYWSRKVRKGRKPKEVKKVWDLPYNAQNFVSALFFLRSIDFANIKEFTFPMADEGKNVILKGKVIKKERINTDAGQFEAWLVEPKFHINGSLAPVDQLKMWFKADKSQSLVKIQTKLKFGSIVGEAVKLVEGQPSNLESIRKTASERPF